MNLDTCKIVTPGLDPGVHLSSLLDGRVVKRKTRFALSPSRDS